MIPGWESIETLVGRFTTTIAEFFTAMGEAFQGGPTSTHERPETREREVRHPPDDWESLRQLRGFKGL